MKTDGYRCKSQAEFSPGTQSPMLQKCYKFLSQELTDDVLRERKLRWQPPPRRLTGLLQKYSRVVSSAHAGAVTH